VKANTKETSQELSLIYSTFYQMDKNIKKILKKIYIIDLGCELGVRTVHTLEKLEVKNLLTFLSLTNFEILQTPKAGVGVLKEVTSLQHHINKIIEELGDQFDVRALLLRLWKDYPTLKLRFTGSQDFSLQKLGIDLTQILIVDFGNELRTKATAFLKKKRVNSIQEFLDLTRSYVMNTSGMDITIWRQILQLQLSIQSILNECQTGSDASSLLMKLYKVHPTFILYRIDKLDGTLKLVTNPALDYSSFDHIIRSFIQNAVSIPRDIEIALARLGIGRDAIPTLQEVGNAYGLTRERIRQIEKRALKIKVSKGLESLSLLWESIDGILNTGGGIQTIDNLAIRLRQCFSWRDKPSYESLIAILSLTSRYMINKDKGLVILLSHPCPKCKLLQSFVKSVVEGAKTGMVKIHDTNARATSFCREKCSKKNKPESFSNGFIVWLVMQLGLRIYGDRIVTMRQWSLYYSKPLIHVALETLKNIGHPVHYKDLAEKIRQKSSRYANITDRQLYKRISKHRDKIKSIGYGIYILPEWKVRNKR